MAEAVFGQGDLYTHARGPNRVILNGASDNPGAQAMTEAVFGPGDLYTHARGPNRVILMDQELVEQAYDYLTASRYTLLNVPRIGRE